MFDGVVDVDGVDYVLFTVGSASSFINMLNKKNMEVS